MATTRVISSRKTASKTPQSDAPPHDNKAAQTRRKILDAAAATFAVRGFQTAKLNEIAALASMKGGSLYFHFESKDVLIREVLREGVLRTLDQVRSAVDALGPDADVRTRLQIAVTTHVNALHTMATYTAAVLGEIEGVSEATRLDFRKHERTYAHYWDELVAEAQAAGYLVANASPRDVRRLIFGTMNATATRRDKPVDIKAQTQLVIAFLRLDDKGTSPRSRKRAATLPKKAG